MYGIIPEWCTLALLYISSSQNKILLTYIHNLRDFVFGLRNNKKNFFYTIISDIGTCGCPIGITGTPYYNNKTGKINLLDFYFLSFCHFKEEVRKELKTFTILYPYGCVREVKPAEYFRHKDLHLNSLRIALAFFQTIINTHGY
uniref:Uncharacterized protein n=1 Tax=Rhizophagus irregularis (strain DAOM 181602 / DAOM 197198 / MUCL 43194) TaxID=747089 RepID=U9SH81_RHIID